MLPKNFYTNSKDLIRIAFPVILAQLGTVLLGITNTIMLEWIGTEEIETIGISNQVYFVITVIGMGCMTALTSIVAYSKGKNNFKECGEYLRTGVEMVFLLSIGIVAVLFLITENAAPVSLLFLRRSLKVS